MMQSNHVCVSTEKTHIEAVAFIGATGNIGRVLLDALERSQKFNLRVICRKRTPRYNELPESLLDEIHEVNFDCHTSLVRALRGCDAVVCSIPFPSFDAADIELPVIRAAIDANVKLFIPSEFAVDTTAPVIPNDPVQASKRAVHQYLLARAHLISHTVICLGVLPEFHLQKHSPHCFGSHGVVGIDLVERSAYLPDGGKHPFAATSYITAGNALIAVLSSFPHSKNRILRFSDGVLTPLEVLGLAEEKTEAKFEMQSYDLSENLQQVTRAFAAGRTDKLVQCAALRTPYMGGLESSVFDHTDNEEFGVEQQDIRKIIGDFLASTVQKNLRVCCRI